MSERNEEYKIYISPVGLAEMTKSPQEKKVIFATLLSSIKYANMPESDEVEDLADEYAKSGFLTAKHSEDLKHIAYAVIAQCDYIISWNMRHIVREKTISGVRAVNMYNNYNTPFIVTPEIFIEKTS